MDEQFRSDRLSPTVEETRRIVRGFTDAQRNFVCTLDAKLSVGRSISQIAERMGRTDNDVNSILRGLGKIVHEELGNEFDMEYMKHHGRTTWSSLLFDALLIEGRWHFTMAPELYAALIAEGLLPRRG